MVELLKNLKSLDEQYNNNNLEICQIQKMNKRLVANICHNIIVYKDPIITLLKENKPYLELIPDYSKKIDCIIKNIEENEIKDIGQSKLILDLLDEINVHLNNDNIEKTENECNETKKTKGLLDKYLYVVKGGFENDN